MPDRPYALQPRPRRRGTQDAGARLLHPELPRTRPAAEKGGKEQEVPCHHELEQLLHAYIAAAGTAKDPLGPLFRTSRGRSATLNGTAMYQQDVFRMIRRRAGQAGIKTLIGNHTFRATGIAHNPKNGGTLEMAQYIDNHESPRPPSSTTAGWRSSVRARSRGFGCDRFFQ